VAASASTLCAIDDSNQTVVLKTDTNWSAGAIVGLHGWLSTPTATILIHGTALVDQAKQGVKIEIQGINNVTRQYVGIVMDADLMLNGSGVFENINNTRPFQVDERPVTWTALDACPAAPAVSSSR
jgi:hypothetical protein